MLLQCIEHHARLSPKIVALIPIEPLGGSNTVVACVPCVGDASSLEMLSNVSPYSVNNLCTSLCAHNGTVWHGVAEQLDVLWFYPLAVYHFPLVYHEIMNNPRQIAFSVGAHLVAASTITVKEHAPILQPSFGHRFPIRLFDGAGSW